jgi:nucleotide sugar dehydrogenase
VGDEYMSEHINKLREGKMSIGIIGAGFIGTTTALFYAHEGVKSIIYDIDQKKVEKYKMGLCDVINLEQWSGFNLKEFVDKGLITPTNDVNKLKGIKIFFVAVPTEKGGEPFEGYIKKVIEDLMILKPELIIIESTMSPNWIKSLKLNELPICIAIRRDWFSNPLFTLKTIPRIYCASTPKLNELACEVMSIVSDKLIKASSLEVSALVKSVENALWHVQLVAVQELATLYDCDVDEILKLVATHPQRIRYYPNIKVGGYCVPLGSKYVRDSADHPENLMLFTAAIEKNERTPKQVVKHIVDTFPIAMTFGVLGLTYKNDLKVHTLSPGMSIIKELQKYRKTVYVHDCFYTPDEIEKITGCNYLYYPNDLGKCDIIIVTIDHKAYYETPLWILQEKIKESTTIIDNLGVWSKYSDMLKNYIQFGKNWRF